ncbi:MAG: hypothetical protein SGILL_006501 [Bacillariaceae sp.]
MAMTKDTIARQTAMSKRAGSALLVLTIFALSHLVLNENHYSSQFQVRSVFSDFRAVELNGSAATSDRSIAEMKEKLDELNENMKLLLASAPILETNDTSLQAATSALEAATSAMTSAVIPATPQSHYEPPPFPYHVLYGLDGDAPGFLEELEVSLKSILLNAPLDDPLEIHLIASQKSYDQLDRIFNISLLDSFRTRTQITIHAYNVQPMVKSWQMFLGKYFSKHWKSTYDPLGANQVHTIGAFFRLFAHQVLPKSVHKMLYLDNDAILMANMRELWKDVAANNPNAVFHWGEYTCSGFMVLDSHRIQDIWDLAAKGNLSARPNPWDQDVLITVNETFPEEIGILPPAWDVSVANTIWTHNKDLLKVRPNLGMMHFNGGGSNPANAFQVHNFLKVSNSTAPPNWKNTFHLARYYANMPWEWTRYWAKSMVTSKGESGRDGYPIKIVHHENLKPPNMRGLVKAP